MSEVSISRRSALAALVSGVAVVWSGGSAAAALARARQADPARTKCGRVIHVDQTVPVGYVYLDGSGKARMHSSTALRIQREDGYDLSWAQCFDGTRPSSQMATCVGRGHGYTEFAIAGRGGRYVMATMPGDAMNVVSIGEELVFYEWHDERGRLFQDWSGSLREWRLA